MRRFVFVAGLGQMALMTGHIGLGLGLHPSRLASFGHLAQGCGGLVLGTALFITGLLGLAEAYERVSDRLGRLLRIKQLPSDGDMAVTSQEDLGRQHSQFWKAYQRSSAGICLFLGGILLLSVVLSRASFSLYLSAVGIGIVALGVAAAGVGYGGLRRMRRAHVTVEQTALSLDAQPDIPCPQPVLVRRRQPAYALFRNHSRHSQPNDPRRSPPRTASRPTSTALRDR